MCGIQSDLIGIYQEGTPKANIELGLSILRYKRLLLKNEKVLPSLLGKTTSLRINVID